MTRCISMTKAANALVSDCAKSTGDKISKTVCDAVISYCMPTPKPLYVEAAYLLQLHQEDAVTPWLVKQSISRGVQWLGRHTIDDPTIVKKIAAHFEALDAYEVAENASETVRNMLDVLRDEITQYDEACGLSPCEFKNLFEDISSHWAVLGQAQSTYTLLATLVFTQEPTTPFSWSEGIHILKEIELYAQAMYLA